MKFATLLRSPRAALRIISYVASSSRIVIVLAISFRCNVHHNRCKPSILAPESTDHGPESTAHSELALSVTACSSTLQPAAQSSLVASSISL